MKRLIKITILIILTFGSFSVCSAQTAVYNTCASLSDYNGEWKYEENGTVIKMFFRAHTFHSPNINLYEEKLLGWHEYVVNGQVIESDYQHRFVTVPTNFFNQSDVQMSIKLNFELCKPVLSRLYGSFDDLTRNQGQSIIFTRLTANTVKIEQHPGGGGLTPQTIGYTLPQTFILTRQ